MTYLAASSIPLSVSSSNISISREPISPFIIKETSTGKKCCNAKIRRLAYNIFAIGIAWGVSTLGSIAPTLKGLISLVGVDWAVQIGAETSGLGNAVSTFITLDKGEMEREAAIHKKVNEIILELKEKDKTIANQSFQIAELQASDAKKQAQIEALEKSFHQLNESLVTRRSRPVIFHKAA